MNQRELASFVLRSDVNGHEAFVRSGDAPSENKATGSVNSPVSADMIDLCFLSPHQETELTADPRIDFEVQHSFVAKCRPEHPLANAGSVEPGVKNSLARRVETPHDADSHRARGLILH
jgi:hypothetical protein